MYVADKWGMSFIVPGALIIACGIFVWLFLIVKPGDVDIELSPEVADQDQEDYEDIQQVVVSSLYSCFVSRVAFS